MNHYQRLGVAIDGQPDLIRAAHRRRARATHPDSTGSVDDEMAAVNAAWFVLRDPERRRRYDGVIGSSPSTGVGAWVGVPIRATSRSADRSARTLVGMFRAAILLSVVTGGVFMLIALLQGH